MKQQQREEVGTRPQCQGRLRRRARVPAPYLRRASASLCGRSGSSCGRALGRSDRGWIPPVEQRWSSRTLRPGSWMVGWTAGGTWRYMATCKIHRH